MDQSIILNNVNKLFEESNIPEEVWALLDFDNFAKSNPPYYINYPAQFIHGFTAIDDTYNVVKDLSTAGFLYYRSLLIQDALLDNDISVHSKRTLLPILMTICQEEAIKLLSKYFDDKSKFWPKYWNKRRLEYLIAVNDEKKITITDQFSDERYFSIARGKSCFGKIAIDSLKFLSISESDEAYLKMVDAHDQFSDGLQLIDDFQDFVDDIVVGQPNYLYRMLDLDRSYRVIDRNHALNLKRQAYINGTTETLLKFAIRKLTKAKSIIECIKAGPILFTNTIESNIQEIEMMQNQISKYKYITRSKAKVYSVPSSKKYQEINIEEILPDYSDNDGICILSSLSFIISQANRSFLR